MSRVAVKVSQWAWRLPRRHASSCKGSAKKDDGACEFLKSNGHLLRKLEPEEDDPRQFCRGEYKNVPYFMYHPYTFYEVFVLVQAHRLEQPDASKRFEQQKL